MGEHHHLHSFAGLLESLQYLIVTITSNDGLEDSCQEAEKVRVACINVLNLDPEKDSHKVPEQNHHVGLDKAPMKHNNNYCETFLGERSMILSDPLCLTRLRDLRWERALTGASSVPGAFTTSSSILMAMCSGANGFRLLCLMGFTVKQGQHVADAGLSSLPVSLGISMP